VDRNLMIYGGVALTMDAGLTELKDAVIEVENGKIKTMSSQPGYQPPAGVNALKAHGSWILPGLINGHTHVGMTLLRGVADDKPLRPWLEETIFPLEKKFGTTDFVYWGTKLAAAEMIRAGVTTINDMYYFEEHAARAIDEVGMRAVLGQTVIEISGVEQMDSIFKKLQDFVEKMKSYPTIRAAIAPHSIYGVSKENWVKVRQFAENHEVPIHLHLSETEDETSHWEKKYGMTPAQFFDGIGLWDQKAIAAHSTCLRAVDIEILGRHKTGIIYNPESNLKLGSKICPVVELRQSGAQVGFGTDGVASNNNLDLLDEADVGAKLQTYRYGVGSLKTRDVLRMLTSEGAKAIYWADEIGSLEVGKSADIIVVSHDALHLQPIYCPYSQLVYSAGGQDVRHTVVAGQVLMRDRQLLTIDEAEILETARQWGKKIAQQFSVKDK